MIALARTGMGEQEDGGREVGMCCEQGVPARNTNKIHAPQWAQLGDERGEGGKGAESLLRT